MTLGFVCWAIMGFIIGGALGPIQTITPLFLVLYGIFNSFGEMGPGVATVSKAQNRTRPFSANFTSASYSSFAVPSRFQHRYAVTVRIYHLMGRVRADFMLQSWASQLR